MIKVKTIYSVVFLLVTSITLSAKTPISTGDTHSKSSDFSTYIDENQILMFATNQGIFGRDLDGTFGYDYGTFYPFSGDINDIIMNIGNAADKSPLYSAGICLGGIVSSEVRVTAAEYSAEYVPGPMSGGTFQANIPEFKIYKLYSDSLDGNPNNDYTNWPNSQGAPVGGSGHPLMIGHQMLWSVFNDADTAAHNNAIGSTDPLGVEIQQTVFAYSTSANAIYLKYKLLNKGANSIQDMYISFWVEPNIGNSGDDLVGCDSLNDIFFCYNSSNTDTQYGSPPPALGFKILAGPLVASTGDSALFENSYIMDYKNLGMTSFQKLTSGSDPGNAQETYNYMQGLKKNGMPYVYFGDQTTYINSGDPVDGTGDLDGTALDKRMMASSGPFDFNPGDSQFVIIKMSVSTGVDYLNSITQLKNDLNFPEQIPTDVITDNLTNLPNDFYLSQNFPNPFNPTTTITYSLPFKSDVAIDIFNLLGQKVRTFEHKDQSAGTHSIVWNGTDNSGRVLSSGLYMYKLTSGDFTTAKKMILLK